ncbi:caspase family protein [Scytonema sp. PCC 10023]|uniref:caspase family protein n=1 Tax=Scytonema sp. PCC 10023 TaxID=1680591 RepID=UPI0039C631BF
MAKNWAIAIGINEYDDLQRLNYAKQDAQAMQNFLRDEAGFEKVLLFSDDSPDVKGNSTRPTHKKLLSVLTGLLEKPFMKAGDNFWFFFSGHGMRHNDRDYLMPKDGHPNDIENTAIPTDYVIECLRRSGADNVVLILDACRTLGTRAGNGIGQQTASVARQTGVISIFSCSPNEYAYEIDKLGKGAFTHALLEGLEIQGKYTTVKRLSQYLRLRVPEIVRQYKGARARQMPQITAKPENKSHLILIPQNATPADIATLKKLKKDASQAEADKQFELAKQLWIQVLAAASDPDEEAIDAIKRIAANNPSSLQTLPSPSSATQNSGTQNHTPNPFSTAERGSESESPTPSPLLVPRDNLSSKKLSAEQLKKLQDTFIDAFPTKSSLEQLLSLLSSELDKNLDAIAREGNLSTLVFNLIETADAQGWVEDLICVARELNLGNSRLRDTAQELLTQSKSKETEVSNTRIEQKGLEQQQKILILITIPHNWLLDKEIQEIEEVIRRVANQDFFEICVRTAVYPQEIRQVIAKEQPQIVHLCGHGMKDGRLLLEDDEGNNKPVSPEGLASLFNLQGATVKCVLLNSCYSQLSAEAISQHINYVIGMNQSIKDKAAIKFIQGFYNILGAKTSENQDVFQRAFDEGLNTIQLENLSQESIPVLKKILLEQF